jgi:hypothetical protein
VLVGTAVPAIVTLFVAADQYAAGARPGGAWAWLSVLLFLGGPPAGGYLADRLFHKTRRYDPDYDDRPPTDPA